MLSPKGRLIGDFTVSCLSENEFFLIASYGSQNYHMRWFISNLCGEVEVENISDERTGFQIAGPKAQALLKAAAGSDISDIKFMDVRKIVVGMIPCLVQRVSYTGDLGYEIYCQASEQRQLWHSLWSKGQAFGLKPFGMRAMMSLRLDRFFGSWLSEYSPDYTPAETGLDRFISWSKPIEFIGKEAALEESKNGSARRLVAFEVMANDADVVAYEPVWMEGAVVGFCTSGGYSHYAGKSIALALIPTERVMPGLTAEIEILGQKCAARLLDSPLLKV